MRKLKLQVEDLEIVSFETVRLQDGRGTVAGHVEQFPASVQGNTCTSDAVCNPAHTRDGGNTCQESCQGTFCYPYSYNGCIAP
jgi:hypothetical protein